MQFKKYELHQQPQMIEEFTRCNDCDQCYVAIRSNLDKSFPQLLWENVSGFLSVKGPQRMPTPSAEPELAESQAD